MASHRGSCLCGEVAYEIDGPLEHASHCHCSYCRKFHGTPYATVRDGAVRGRRWLRGEQQHRALRIVAGVPALLLHALRLAAAGRSVRGVDASSRSATSTATRACAPRSTCSPRRRRRGGRSATGCPRSTRFRPASMRPWRRISRRATRRARRAGAACAARSHSGSRASRCVARELPLRALPQGARRRARDQPARADRRRALHARRGRARAHTRFPRRSSSRRRSAGSAAAKAPRVDPRPRLRDRADGRARRRSGPAPAVPHLRRLEGAVGRDPRRPAAPRRSAPGLAGGLSSARAGGRRRADAGAPARRGRGAARAAVCGALRRRRGGELPGRRTRGIARPGRARRSRPIRRPPGRRRRGGRAARRERGARVRARPRAARDALARAGGRGAVRGASAPGRGGQRARAALGAARDAGQPRRDPVLFCARRDAAGARCVVDGRGGARGCWRSARARPRSASRSRSRSASGSCAARPRGGALAIGLGLALAVGALGLAPALALHEGLVLWPLPARLSARPRARHRGGLAGVRAAGAAARRRGRGRAPLPRRVVRGALVLAPPRRRSRRSRRDRSPPSTATTSRSRGPR